MCGRGRRWRGRGRRRNTKARRHEVTKDHEEEEDGFWLGGLDARFELLVGAILLLVAALACVAMELFLPSHGVLALCAALLALGSIIMGYRAYPAAGILIGAVIVICAPIVFFYAIKLYPSTPMGKRVMLKTPPASVRDPFAQESARLGQLVGQRAVAATMLRPAGTIEVNGERIDAVSEAEVIVAGTAVEILRVNGLKVIVKAASPPTTTTTTTT